MENVFVGFYFDEEKERELLASSRMGVSTAPNQYQKGFLSGLSEKMRIFTAISTGSFPRLNTRLIYKKSVKEIPEGTLTYLPFLNFYIIRDWQFQRGLYKNLKKIIQKQPYTTVYVYSIHLPFVKVMDRLKRKYKDKFHYCLIIPDLAGRYGLIRKGIKGVKDRLEAKKKMSLANRADSFVFLTEAMKELFDPKPYAVIEGFLPSCEFDYTNRRIPKTVLYTGSLNRAYGFGTLLEAFSKIPDEDAQLWICGAGDMEADIKEAARKDQRIKFKGFLPKSEIASLQTQCDVLINPRPPEGEYTKYSFPSKTMEYLLSGSKVVMYRLPGIRSEYYEFIRTIACQNADSVAKTIISAFNDTEFYRSRWADQVRWIKSSKDAKQQIQKVLHLHGRSSV